jgi:hypothetical protein
MAMRQVAGEHGAQEPEERVAEPLEYQRRDQHIIDYQLFDLPHDLWVRGPKPPLEAGNFFVCVGAAQTFGRFCERPYPTILSKELGLPVLNLSAAGAGPLFFLRRPRLFEYVNRARFAVVQVMAGRSENNSLFESRGTALLRRRSDGSKILAEAAFRELLRTGSEELVRRIVGETRSNWLAHYSELFGKIEIPTILFWFSKRTPHYPEDYSNVRGLFGEYPQLVNAEMVAKLEVEVDDYVECVSSRGFPQALVDRTSGAPTTAELGLGKRVIAHNTYYPSPEMHEDAAAALREPARSMLALAADARRAEP